eukprot:COSAG02_NODE_1862_length_10609_cov_36.585616_5_plen_145_part_00
MRIILHHYCWGVSNRLVGRGRKKHWAARSASTRRDSHKNALQQHVQGGCRSPCRAGCSVTPRCASVKHDLRTRHEPEIGGVAPRRTDKSPTTALAAARSGSGFGQLHLHKRLGAVRSGRTVRSQNSCIESGHCVWVRRSVIPGL